VIFNLKRNFLKKKRDRHKQETNLENEARESSAIPFAKYFSPAPLASVVGTSVPSFFPFCFSLPFFPRARIASPRHERLIGIVFLKNLQKSAFHQKNLNFVKM
ncbi:hypothetical protein YC68_24600, partial [Vibrio parahaemolyticus]